MLINRGSLRTLHTGFKTHFDSGFGQAVTDYEDLVMRVPSMTAEEEYGWLGQFPGLKEWLGEREVRGIAEHGYVIRNRRHQATVAVDADKIRDDQYGVYAPMFTEMGRAAKALPGELAYGLLKKGDETKCYDGQYFFDTDHPGPDGNLSNWGGGNGSLWILADLSRSMKPLILQEREPYDLDARFDAHDEEVWRRNQFEWGVTGRCNVGFGLWQLAYGSQQELNAANYKTARQKMLDMPGDQGRPMGVMPTHLIVPPTLEEKARKLLVAQLAAGGETNVWAGSAQVKVSPWLAAA